MFCFRFHTFNATRPSDSVPAGVALSEEELFARPSSDSRAPRGWLVDLINRFGVLGGFQALLERFQTGKNLTLSVVYALIRPFGLCYEYLTVHTVTKFLMPVLVRFLFQFFFIYEQKYQTFFSFNFFIF